MISVDVREASQVAGARREAVAAARSLGFNEEDAGRVAIVATELSTNLLKHAGRGALLVGTFEDDAGAGVTCVALDQGGGIADWQKALQDGQSTVGSAGNGLGAVRRTSQVFDVYSVVGAGTAILAQVTASARGRSPRSTAVGAVSLPIHGETSCGDDWAAAERDPGSIFIVADGLGHGVDAARAAHEAMRTLRADRSASPAGLLGLMHPALKSTRGAAVSIAQVDQANSAVVFAGVGNVASALVAMDGGTRRMVSHNGTVGHVMSRVQEFTYAFDGPSLLIMHSDGLATGWSLAEYPGLNLRHPELIAAVLYRDFNRGRDDVTVLVARLGWPR